MHGGIAQGIAQALYEEAVYDDDGNLVTGTLVDYLVPAAADLPSFDTDRTETPSTTNPLGVKGVGEAGTIASTPAVVNAVVDALRQLGVERRPDAVHPGARLAGHPGAGVGRRRPCRRGHRRLRRRQHRDHRRRCGSDPGRSSTTCAPRSVDEAVAALRRARRGRQGDRRRAVACCRCCGCGWPTPSVLVDVGRVDELRGVREDGDALVIGAMTTHHEVLHDPLVARARRLLAEATATVADPAVRHRGTFGGVAGARRPGRRPAGGRRCAGRRRDRGGPRRPPDRRRRRTSSSTTCRPRSRRTSCWSRSGCPSSGRAGATGYEKFHRVAQSWAIVGVAAAVRRDERHHRRGQGRR